MKNAKIMQLFNGWFWAWLGIAAALVGIMILTPAHKEVLSSIIIMLFMVMPFRNGFYRLVVWLIDYQCSNNTTLRDRINPHATYNTLANPKERVENTGFYRMLWGIIAIACLMLGLVWMVFKGTSFQVVYAWLRSLEFLFTGKYSPLRVLVLIIVKVAYYYGVIWAWGIILNAKMFQNGHFSMQEAWWRLLIMAIGYWGNILLTALLLKFSGAMTLAALGYKTVLLIVGVPTLYLIIWRIGRILFPSVQP